MTRAIVEALEKLQAAVTYDDPKFDFVKDYTYGLGVNDLVKYGADQCVIGSEMPFCFHALILLFRLGLTLWERKLSSVIEV